MRQKIITVLMIFYLGGAFVDYLAREGIKKGLWDNILWRDGMLPLVSLAKGLLWPVNMMTHTKTTMTTAEQLVELLHNVNNYPLCSSKGCIQSIEAMDNTVIATYTIPRTSSEFSEEMFVDRAATADMIRPNALRDICGTAQADLPDGSMKWAGHYYTSDGIFLASILVTMNECPNK